MNKKNNLNLLITILSFFIMVIYVCLFVKSYCFDSGAFILSFVLIGTYYLSRIKTKNKIVNKLFSLISVLLFLFITGVIIISLFSCIISTYNIDEFYSTDPWMFVLVLCFLFKIFIDSIINYRKKEIDFSCILKIISLFIIDLVLFRLLIDKVLYRDTLTSMDLYATLSQNNLYFFVMLFVCVVNSVDYFRPLKTRLETMAKIFIASLATLTFISLIDALNIYVASYEYRPIICLHETHSEDKSTYYSFGYSITYHYGEEVVAEYRLFNLIPFYKK